MTQWHDSGECCRHYHKSDSSICRSVTNADSLMFNFIKALQSNFTSPKRQFAVCGLSTAASDVPHRHINLMIQESWLSSLDQWCGNLTRFCSCTSLALSGIVSIAFMTAEQIWSLRPDPLNLKMTFRIKVLLNLLSIVASCERQQMSFCV